MAFKPIITPSERGHSDADHLLRRAICYYTPGSYVKPPISWPPLDAELGDRHTLRYPQQGNCWLIEFRVRELVNHPDVVLIASTNWRAEHEPDGFMRVEAARALWRKLLATGMQEVSP